jgi:hypothetical protein
MSVNLPAINTRQWALKFEGSPFQSESSAGQGRQSNTHDMGNSMRRNAGDFRLEFEPMSYVHLPRRLDSNLFIIVSSNQIECSTLGAD